MKIQLCLAVSAGLALAATLSLALPATAAQPQRAPVRTLQAEMHADSLIARSDDSFSDRQQMTAQPAAFTGFDWGDDQSHLHLGAFRRPENTDAPHPDFDPHAKGGVGLAMSFKLGS